MRIVQQKGYTTRQFLRASTTFFTVTITSSRAKKLTKLDVPADANFSYWQNRIGIPLEERVDGRRQDVLAGSYLVIPFEKFLKGERNFTVLFEGAIAKSLSGARRRRRASSWSMNSTTSRTGFTNGNKRVVHMGQARNQDARIGHVGRVGAR